MIAGIKIGGFKRFYENSFELKPLTILTGLNGSGKTSFIHSLLLLSEASSSAVESVRLNGPFGLALGTAEGVRNWRSVDLISIEINSPSTPLCVWRFGVPSDKALYLTIEEKPVTSPQAFSLLPRAFTYLCAERLGPRSISGLSPLPPENLEVGVSGEFCGQIIATLGNKLMEEIDRYHPSDDSGTPTLLKYEVERWLGEIARPVEIEAVTFPAGAAIAMRFRSRGGDWVSAPNMGFGVSYALPIILAGLIAKPGGLLIVENPEAHLHPAGQSRMGVFLGWLASRGVQIVVETHSDHVLNGIRRSIGEYQYLLHDQAVVHFFESDDADQPKTHSLEFTSIGGVSHWPRGFFDQYQVDIATLGQLRRRST